MSDICLWCRGTGEEPGLEFAKCRACRYLSDIPEPMRSALAGQDAEFLKEMADRYRAADEDTKADILAFFESDGPRMVHEARAAHADGVPTSAELNAAAGVTCESTNCRVCGSAVYMCETPDPREIPGGFDYRCPLHPGGAELGDGTWVCSEGCYEIAVEAGE